MPPNNILNQNELDFLLQGRQAPQKHTRKDEPGAPAAQRHAGDAPGPEAGQESGNAAMEAMAGRFCRSLSRELSFRLSRYAQLKQKGHVTRTTVASLSSLLSGPASFTLLSVPPEQGQILFGLDIRTSQALVDASLGALPEDIGRPSPDPRADRRLSAIENALLEHLLQGLPAILAEAWQRGFIAPQVLRRQTNPGNTPVLPDDPDDTIPVQMLTLDVEAARGHCLLAFTDGALAGA